MNRRYLILDCNYLCHRAKYVFGDLSDKGSATGVIYGFLRDLLIFQRRFDTDHFVFTWDYGVSIRKQTFPEYKENRRDKKQTNSEKAFDEEFHSQVAKLRDEHLLTIGFKNIFYQDGYEADDVIASIAKGIVPDLEEAVIITADTDLFQCIRHNVAWYNPRKKLLMTWKRFQKTFSLRPKQWAKVKAIAGCNSDNVPGIHGVGEITAISYLTGRLKPNTKAHAAIKRGWKDVVLRNRSLVELPHKGTKSFRIEQDSPTQRGWNKVTKSLGMKSILYRKIT